MNGILQIEKFTILCIKWSLLNSKNMLLPFNCFTLKNKWNGFTTTTKKNPNAVVMAF